MNDAQLIALGGMLMIFCIIMLAMLILLVIARWRLFSKAGEKGWKSLIPIYSSYVMYKLVWSAKSFVIYVVLWAVSVIATLASGQYAFLPNGQMMYVGGGSFILGFLSTIASIGVLVYMVLFSIKTALAFGRKPAFAIGLLLLPSIFTLILAFGSAQYQGPQE